MAAPATAISNESLTQSTARQDQFLPLICYPTPLLFSSSARLLDIFCRFVFKSTPSPLSPSSSSPLSTHSTQYKHRVTRTAATPGAAAYTDLPDLRASSAAFPVLLSALSTILCTVDLSTIPTKSHKSSSQYSPPSKNTSDNCGCSRNPLCQFWASGAL